MKSLFILVFILIVNSATGQIISPNGYSGLGIVPSSKTLEKGTLIYSVENTTPGFKENDGFNGLVGVGINDNIEIVGRIATNDLKCNMFKVEQCPKNTYRDFSSSIKWSVPSEWLIDRDNSLALGVTDFGGAATYFRSYYWVGTKSINDLDLSLGMASAKAPNAMLSGSLASLTWNPSNNLKVSIQKVGPYTSAHALIQRQITQDGTIASVTLNHQITNSPLLSKNWIGWSLAIPLDRVRVKDMSDTSKHANLIIEKKSIKKINSSQISNKLKANGFFNSKIEYEEDGKLIIEIENTAYAWNILDAAGVALGVISSAYSLEKGEQDFDLIISTRGIKQIKISGEANCVASWLSNGDFCNRLKVKSLLQRSNNLNISEYIDNHEINIINALSNDISVSMKNIRPEIILSPAVISSIGTEYGTFDFDLGANINTIIPLWTGATIDLNRLEPLGVGTRQFEQAGAFWGARIKPVTNRKLIHQLINLSSINTQLRLSGGTAYSSWQGSQIETSTQSDNGRQKIGYTSGFFKNELPGKNNQKTYQLFNLRNVNNDQQTSATEITLGKFWGGDKGFNINQKFWYGDTTLNVYFRRSRMGGGQPLVSFAGIQFAFPFTPRENKSLEKLGVRGVSQWTYSLETKVLEKDNIITSGYGEVPRIGDSLITTFNRDRNSTRYYNTNLARMRNAYLNLGSD